MAINPTVHKEFVIANDASDLASAVTAWINAVQNRGADSALNAVPIVIGALRLDMAAKSDTLRREWRDKEAAHFEKALRVLEIGWQAYLRATGPHTPIE